MHTQAPKLTLREDMENLRKEKHDQFLASKLAEKVELVAKEKATEKAVLVVEGKTAKNAELVAALKKFNEVNFDELILPSFTEAHVFHQELANGRDIALVEELKKRLSEFGAEYKITLDLLYNVIGDLNSEIKRPAKVGALYRLIQSLQEQVAAYTTPMENYDIQFRKFSAIEKRFNQLKQKANEINAAIRFDVAELTSPEPKKSLVTYNEIPIELKQLFYLMGLATCHDKGSLVEFIIDYAKISRAHYEIVLNVVSIEYFYSLLENRYGSNSAELAHLFRELMYFSVSNQSKILLKLLLEMSKYVNPNFYLLKKEISDTTFVAYSDVAPVSMQETKYAEPLLHYAIQKWEVGAIWLIEASANVFLPNYRKYFRVEPDKTALHVAAKLGKTKIIKRIIKNNKANFDIDVKDSEGKTPLHCVVEQGVATNLGKILLACGADVNARDKNGKTPLHYAMYYGRKDWVEFLLKHKAIVDIQDKEGRTPLHCAIEGGTCTTELGQKLIVAGADIYIHYKTNMLAPHHISGKNSLLHFAASLGRPEWVSFFIDKGICVNERNEYGKTPLHMVVRGEEANKEGRMAVIEILLNEKASSNASDTYGKTPLHLAVEMNRPWVVRYLLARSDADPNARDNKGETPFHIAAQRYNQRCCIKLLAKGADINAVNGQGDSTLIAAAKCEASYGNAFNEVVMLLNRGAQVDSGFKELLEGLKWPAPDIFAEARFFVPSNTRWHDDITPQWNRIEQMKKLVDNRNQNIKIRTLAQEKVEALWGEIKKKLGEEIEKEIENVFISKGIVKKQDEGSELEKSKEDADEDQSDMQISPDFNFSTEPLIVQKAVLWQHFSWFLTQTKFTDEPSKILNSWLRQFKQDFPNNKSSEELLQSCLFEHRSDLGKFFSHIGFRSKSHRLFADYVGEDFLQRILSPSAERVSRRSVGLTR